MASGIVVAALSPHPPIIVPEVGGREADRASATVEGLQSLASRVASAHPDTVVVITPHGPVLRDALVVSVVHQLRGDLGQFGAPGVRVDMENDMDLALRIVDELAAHGVPCVVSRGRPGALDHGSLIPLYFLNRAGVRCRLVSVTIGMLDRKTLFEAGRRLRESCEALERRVALVASGDLSHRLIRGAPAGYSPSGREFDRQLVDALAEGDSGAVLGMDEDLAEDAGECGLRPIVMMLGSLDGLGLVPEVLSYEGPFGVGYATAVFEKGSATTQASRKAGTRRMQDPYVALARLSLETFIREGRPLSKPRGLPQEMSRRAGAFVSLKKSGQLRGCIGTIEPYQADVASEIIRNAISAGTEDPRFDPVSAAEMKDLEYSVDVLSQPEEIPDESGLDPSRYGVIVQKGHRRGLLLPDLEGVDSVAAQVSIARQKAGIRPADPDVKLFRFTVERHH